MKRVKNNGMNGTTSPSHVLRPPRTPTRADYPPKMVRDSPVGPASHRGADRSTTERRQEGNCGKEPVTGGGRKKISHVGLLRPSGYLVRELGMTCTAVGERLVIGQPAVSVVLARGEKIVKEKGFRLPEGRK
jgi:hypothetical protein